MRRSLIAAALTLVATPAFALDLSSPDVADGQTVPTRFVCPQQGGQGISPALNWTGAPAGTKSFAITIHDPDAPAPGGFWHWLVADIPGAATGIAQGADSNGGRLPAGAVGLPNGSGKPGYAGPCPPPAKVHHYQITLYALPTATAALPAGAKSGALDAALAAAALASARITPVFEKQ